MKKWQGICLRILPTEHKAFEEYASRQGLSMNMALREWIRATPEFKAIKAKEEEQCESN